MKNSVVILLFILLHAIAFSQQSSLQQLHYTINVRLDDRHASLDGSLQLRYENLSPDSLYYLWFNLWPNAFKNDRTAYSDMLLDSGRNDFYFSGKEDKGYINRLVFRSGAAVLAIEDHPRFIDVVKVILDKPLPPGDSILLSTPFHVKLPRDFSGFGVSALGYRAVNWYPAIALFDSAGWHPETFTGQSPKQKADFSISVTLPRKYLVLADGTVADSTAADTLKTLTFRATNVNAFSWWAQRPGVKLPAMAKTLAQRMDDATPLLLSRHILPAVGYNVYDGLQLGVAVHNFHIPEKKLTWFATPLYATSSKTLNGYAGVNYNLSPGRLLKKVSVGFNSARFSSLKGNDSVGRKVFAGFYKISPYFRITLPVSDEHALEWLELRTYIIGEREFNYDRYSVDSFFYPTKGSVKSRYVNQLTFHYASFRSLYPYDWQLQIQQSASFYRLNAEAHYFFNYATGGGLQARIFAAKFGYIGGSSTADTYRFQPKLTAVRGEEDYTYGNAFLGRNEFDGTGSRQIMMRDGGLKLRTDLFQNLQGRSDNWIAAVNLSTTLPVKGLPANFPLKLFADAGTYAEAWKKQAEQARFLYVAGLQLSIYKNLLNVYAPVLYSKFFKDSLKTVPEENTFLKRISFTIDLGGLFNERPESTGTVTP